MTYDVCVTEAYVPATEKDNSRKRDCGCVSRCHAIRAFAAPAGNDVCRPHQAILRTRKQLFAARICHCKHCSPNKALQSERGAAHSIRTKEAASSAATVVSCIRNTSYAENYKGAPVLNKGTTEEPRCGVVTDGIGSEDLPAMQGTQRTNCLHGSICPGSLSRTVKELEQLG